jgi:hypothetical protein
VLSFYGPGTSSHHFLLIIYLPAAPAHVNAPLALAGHGSRLICHFSLCPYHRAPPPGSNVQPAVFCLLVVVHHHDAGWHASPAPLFLFSAPPVTDAQVYDELTKSPVTTTIVVTIPAALPSTLSVSQIIDHFSFLFIVFTVHMNIRYLFRKIKITCNLERREREV